MDTSTGTGRPPELLAPAGSVEALDAAVGAGADAVYLGLKNFNARLRSSNFAYSQYEAALRALHRMGKKLYVTVNTVFEQREADRMYQLLKYLAATGPDAIIVQDFGVLKMARDCFPGLRLHASTQMNIASAPAVNFLSKYGVSRAVLARELSLAEIREIRAGTNAGLEVFIHGALCVSASGLCLFSSFLGGKSANRGLCTQACRRFYHQAGGPHNGESGYLFSPADLELAGEIPVLAGAGVNSFKIEGRMKSAEYVGTAVSACRRVLDALDGDVERAIGEARRILKNDFARKKTTFYFDAPYGAGNDAGPDGQADGVRPAGIPGIPAWLDPSQDGGVGIPLGSLLQVRGAEGERRGLVATDLPLEKGDSVRLHRADDSERRAHKLDAVESAAAGRNLPAGGCWISIPEGFFPGDSVYLIQQRGMIRRYPPVIREESGKFRRSPGREMAPEPRFPEVPARRNRDGERGDLAKDLPSGLYVAVSRIEDLFTVQSERPVRVIVSLNPKSLRGLLDTGGAPLPFARREIFIFLDPWFPQADEENLREQCGELLDMGYRHFIVNNPGHFSFFRRGASARAEGGGRENEPVLVAGPWLYAFNTWAEAFLASQGTLALVSPLENSRQNLERSVAPARRARCFVTLFAWPPLFRIRADLSAYGSGTLSDGRDGEFRLACDPWGSRVYPLEPFSILDKRPFLEKAGFRRFIIDLSGISGPVLKKKDYRAVMDAALAAKPLGGSSRFNWKDGFYRIEEPGAEQPFHPAASRPGPAKTARGAERRPRERREKTPR